MGSLVLSSFMFNARKREREWGKKNNKNVRFSTSHKNSETVRLFQAFNVLMLKNPLKNSFSKKNIIL